MALSIQINPGVKFDNTQKFIRIQGTCQVIGTGNYPAGGLPWDSVLLALPDCTTNSGVRRTIFTSLTGSGYIYQRVGVLNGTTGTMMILQIPPNGSLTTAAPLQQIPSSTNMQGIQADVIDFEAEVIRNA